MANERVRYSFKGPGWGRKTFTIYVDIKSAGGKRKCSTVKDERLKAINEAFLVGAKDHESCITQIKEIIRDLYKKDPRCREKFHVHNSENQRVLNDYWEKNYAFRPLVSEYTARNELKNAIEVLGHLSIYSASREEIQARIDAKYEGNSQRRIVQRLTQVLKFIGRTDVKLRKNPKQFVSVTYLNEDEFQVVLNYVSTEIEKALLTLCYYSGLRVGEAYALETHSLLDSGVLRVTSQIDRRGVRRHTKTKRPRLAYLCPKGIAAFRTWVSASQEEKETIDRLEVSRDLMKKYCKLAFPNDPRKHLTFHALRHCYAINLLHKGVSMSLVAQSLGNTLSVCQQYYVGFELTNESIEAINAIVARGES